MLNKKVLVSHAFISHRLGGMSEIPKQPPVLKFFCGILGVEKMGVPPHKHANIFFPIFSFIIFLPYLKV